MTSKKEPIGDRIAKYTDRSAGRDACWPWLGVQREGYGQIRIGGRLLMASHVVYELDRGHPPEHPCVLHTCDNPPCMNPRHLWSGTKTENMHDMKGKGRARAPKGEANGWSKLTAGQVREIRKRHSTGRLSQVRLAADYGVEPTTICKIVRRRAWTHV